MNSTLTQMLGKLSTNINNWYDVLEKVEFVFNNTVNRAIGNTPSRLLFGRDQIGPVGATRRPKLVKSHTQTPSLKISKRPP